MGVGGWNIERVSHTIGAVAITGVAASCSYETMYTRVDLHRMALRLGLLNLAAALVATASPVLPFIDAGLCPLYVPIECCCMTAHVSVSRRSVPAKRRVVAADIHMGLYLFVNRTVSCFYSMDDVVAARIMRSLNAFQWGCAVTLLLMAAVDVHVVGLPAPSEHACYPARLSTLAQTPMTSAIGLVWLAGLGALSSCAVCMAIIGYYAVRGYRLHIQRIRQSGHVHRAMEFATVRLALVQFAFDSGDVIAIIVDVLVGDDYNISWFRFALSLLNRSLSIVLSVVVIRRLRPRHIAAESIPCKSGCGRTDH
ncbi:G-protein coupled receptors family 1 profile domain-containing protein [Plasmodiophora brassicae]